MILYWNHFYKISRNRNIRNIKVNYFYRNIVICFLSLIFKKGEQWFAIETKLKDSSRNFKLVHSENWRFNKKFFCAFRPGSNDAPCRIKPDRPCPPSKYRTPSGACNNVRHPVWGARGAPFLKLLPSAYSDGKWLSDYRFPRICKITSTHL